MGISLDLRQRIVDAHRRGLGSRDHLAAVFGVGTASVARFVRKAREGADLAPLVGRGGKRYIIDGEVLRGIVDAHSDFTLAQLATAYAERMQSPTPHISTVDRALTRLGYTLKKKDASVRRAR